MIQTIELKIICIADYNAISLDVNDIAKYLNPKELDKYNRFVMIRDKINLYLSRKIIYEYVSKNKLDFLRLVRKTSDRGKISFEGNPFFFNISHTDGCIAVAFSKAFELGVDVEQIGELDYVSLFKYCASPNEQKRIKEAIDPKKEFYRLWTMKEAFMKRSGVGITSDLPTIEVFQMAENNAFYCYEKIVKNGYYISLICDPLDDKVKVNLSLVEI